MTNTPSFCERNCSILAHACFLSKVNERGTAFVECFGYIFNAFTVFSHRFSGFECLLSKACERAHVFIGSISVIHPMFTGFCNAFTTFAYCFIQVCECLVSVHCETVVFLHCFNIIVDGFCLSVDSVFTSTEFCYKNVFYFSDF